MGGRARRDALPPEPAPHGETARREILALLRDGEPRTAREISVAVRRPEKEVYGHLVHLARSLRGSGLRLAVRPARCLGCGFSFRKRERLAPPGRCPLCRGESIGDPAFSLAGP